jgi:hypothetical protein
MEHPGQSSPKIGSPKNISPVSGKSLHGRNRLLGYLFAKGEVLAAIVIVLSNLMEVSVMQSSVSSSRKIV